MSCVVINNITAYILAGPSKKYISKMGRHFSHKIHAEYDEHRAQLTFDIGVCVLSMEDGVLCVYCESPSAEALDELKNVIKSHFDRFAIKDNITLIWP